MLLLDREEIGWKRPEKSFLFLIGLDSECFA